MRHWVINGEYVRGNRVSEYLMVATLFRKLPKIQAWLKKRKPDAPRRRIKETVVAVKGPEETFEKREEAGEEWNQVNATEYLKNWEKAQNKAWSINIGTGNCIYSITPILWYNCVFSWGKHQIFRNFFCPRLAGFFYFFIPLFYVLTQIVPN